MLAARSHSLTVIMSDPSLPKVTHTYSQERKGVAALQAYAANHLQIWRETATADVGIDGQLEYVYADETVSGRLAGVQVKAGPSYFKNPTERGWKFYPEAKHRSYWELYPVPVLVILHDTEAKASYWVDARQALRNPRSSEIPFLEIPRENYLEATPPLKLFETTGLQDDAFIVEMDDLITALIMRVSPNGAFPVSFLDLFAGGLTNICRSIYFGADVGINAAETTLEILGRIELGVGCEHDFMWSFVRFLVAQNLADVDVADCLIDWNDRQMLPHFVAPLTSRGRQLVDALQAREREFIREGLMPDGSGSLVAQEGFFGMQLESYYKRLPRIFGFQVISRKRAAEAKRAG